MLVNSCQAMCEREPQTVLISIYVVVTAQAILSESVSAGH